MIFRQLFDHDTWTYTYLLADEESGDAVLIDPVREQMERDLTILEELGLTLRYTLETHVHADHVTSAGPLRDRLGSQAASSATGGAECVDLALQDGDTLQFGRHSLVALATPGHTDGCMSFHLPEERMVFTGDALFIRGCGRTDFQQGDARTLYRSIHDKLLSLPDETLVYPGHDYKGRTVTTVREEKLHNPRLGGGRSIDDFVNIMGALALAPPKHISEAVPANLVCGQTATGESAGADQGSWAPVVRTRQGVPEVTAQWVGLSRGTARVIDVRGEGEFHGPLGHIEGSELVPLGSIPTAARHWKHDDALILVCRSGVRSANAALLLESMGFEKVASLAGGMMAWNHLSQPVAH
jgi:glyoxylase-like metal-dependent hydrolase (beta-lactamase superfamily II)/rhodanese-related sulfurtransferase